MARPLRLVYPGAVYHITARGNERKEIYRTDADRTAFLSILSQAVERYRLVLHAYVLMNNHYHLLLETQEGNLPLAIRHLNGIYSSYFNRSHRRVGHLFQGRYKAIVIEKESYLLELSRYIHLNPIRVKKRVRLASCRWSSYPDYVGKRKAPKWLTTGAVLSQFGKNRSRSESAYRIFVEEGNQKGVDRPWDKTVGQAVLGGESFLRTIRGKMEKGKNREVPDRKRLEARPGFEAIRTRVVEVLSELQFLRTGPRSNPERIVLYYLGRERGGMSLKALAERFGVDDSAVSQGAKRIARLRLENSKLNRILQQIEGELISRI